MMTPLWATPLDEEERTGLIPNHITTTQALNSWEGANILKAESWAFRRRHKRLLTDVFVRRLHERMFDDTWKWAGRYRTTDKTIGIGWHQVPVHVREIMLDAVEWDTHATFPTEEIAARIHHRLVYVHPFSNGNGRHARLFADLYLHQAGQPRFTWGRMNLHSKGQSRSAYITALRAADRGDIAPLLAFARM